jgi:hypothetical protein
MPNEKLILSIDELDLETIKFKFINSKIRVTWSLEDLDHVKQLYRRIQ